jgi:hypothetical protein
MTQSKRSSLFTINRPEWQSNLPRGLRIAAEWQFGTVILAAILSAIRSGELLIVPAAVFGSFVLFLLTSGYFENRRINNPVLWWTFVIFVSAIGAFAIVILIFDPPE